MKFAQDSQDDGYLITAYERDTISVNGKPFQQSLLICQNKLNENWSINNIEALSDEHINQVLAFNPELIIIGTGQKLVFPPVTSYSSIIKRGIGVEFMDTHAACRTYNILVSEGRSVVAGLIL